MAAAMHTSNSVERPSDAAHHPQPRVKLDDCPMCRVAVPSEQLTRLMGRMMCRNCAAAWYYDDDETEDDSKPSKPSRT